MTPADDAPDPHRAGLVLGVWLGAGGVLALAGAVVALGGCLGLAWRVFRLAAGG